MVAQSAPKGVVPTSQERLARAIREMGQFSVVDDSMTEMLHRLATLANDTVEGSDIVGLTMEVDGKLGTPVFTDEESPEIDSVQYRTGTGPCVDTYRDGVVNSIPSTRRDTRWRPFSEACVAHGVLSTLSVPVMSKADKLAAMNFYARGEGAFGSEAEEFALAFAAQAGVVISNSRAYWSARHLGEQLNEALQTRVVIEQAKGLLMSTGKTGEQAFEILKRASQRQNRKLRDVAADLIAEAEKRASR